MSKLSTKQRRARAWRRDWCDHVATLKAENPEWPEGLAEAAANYSQWAMRADGFYWPGLRVPPPGPGRVQP